MSVFDGYTPTASAEDMAQVLRFTNTLATESSINPFTKMSDVAMAGFNQVTNTLAGLTQSFKTLFTVKTVDLELGFSPIAVSAAVHSCRYVDMGEMLAYRPAGLNCTYRTYLDQLCECAEFIHRADKEFLQPYQEFVTETLGGKMNRSIIGFSVKTDAFTKERLAHLALVSELFNTPKADHKPKEDDLETKWSKVVANNAEWDGVVKVTKDLVEIMNGISRAKLKERADKVSRVLHGIMQTKSTEYSSKTLNDISMGGVEYVSLLEFYSVTYYRVLTMVGALDNTANHIKATMV